MKGLTNNNEGCDYIDRRYSVQSFMLLRSEFIPMPDTSQNVTIF